jgi:signal transduction histidine kinase
MVRASRRGNHLLFEVRDHGTGVPRSQREQIFEPFYRSPGKEPDIAGVGLGLAIARQMAVAQGGNVTCERDKGAGSCFTLVLPAADLPSDFAS